MPARINAGRNWPVPSRASQASTRWASVVYRNHPKDDFDTLVAAIEELRDPQKGPAAAHRRRLAEGLNLVGATAFTPMTTAHPLEADQVVNTTSYSVLKGMECDVVTAIPARVHATALLEISPGVTTSNLDYQINFGGTTGCVFGVRPSWRVVQPIEAVIDLEPETVLSVTAEAKVAAAGASYTVFAGGAELRSRLICRVEARLKT